MNNYEDKIKKFLENFWIESLYSIINLVFLLFLWNLNRELLSKFSSDESLKLLTYQNGKPIVFFVMTVLSIICGIIIVISRFKKILYEDPNLTEILYFGLSVLLISIIIITLIIAINNPILQAIVAVISACTAIVYANN
jgi:hypothetical protein